MARKARPSKTKFKTPFRYYEEDGMFVLYKRPSYDAAPERTGKKFSSEAAAKRAVLEGNAAYMKARKLSRAE